MFSFARITLRDNSRFSSYKIFIINIVVADSILSLNVKLANNFN